MNETVSTLLQTIAENEPKVYAAGKEAGIEEGKKAEYNAFWDAFYQSAEKADSQGALFAGQGWNETTFRPPKDIVINKSANYCFWWNRCNVDLVEWCKMLGINITLKPLYASYLFADTLFTRVPQIDLSKSSNCTSLLARSTKLVTVDKLILSDAGDQSLSSSFVNASSLQNIIIEGVIGKDVEFHHCPLTKASIKSIMSHLSPTATFTVKFSKNIVNTAFETTEGAKDGSTSEEWQAIINAKPANVTVALA